MTKNNYFFLHLVFVACFVLLGTQHADAAREMTPYPRVKLQSLDKATARTRTFEAEVGSTMKFGTVYMRVQSCQKSSPLDQPESAAFLQIWEVDTNEKSDWVFSGWMFSSSPGLSAMDHPIYDVWVIECLDYAEGAEPVEGADSEESLSTQDTEEDPENTKGDILQD